MKRSKLFFPVISTLSVFILGIGNAYSSNNDAIIKENTQNEEFLRIDHAGGGGRGGGYSGSFGSGYGGGYSGGVSGNGRGSNFNGVAKDMIDRDVNDIGRKEREEREKKEREEREKNERDEREERENEIDWSDPDNW